MKRKEIFLIDALGAFLSALCLLTIYNFVELIGMPKQVLSKFISIAILLSFYSFTCYFLNSKKWKQYLFALVFLNIFYCLFTIYETSQNLQTITNLGYLYFGLEIFVILLLAFYELKLCRKTTNG